MAYNEEQIEYLFSKICERISGGESTKSILRSGKDMPSYTTLTKWLQDDENKLDRYARAKQDSADADADNVNHIAEMVLNGTYDSNAARVAIDAYKWSAGKKKPKIYGNTIDITSGGEKMQQPMLSIDPLSDD